MCLRRTVSQPSVFPTKGFLLPGTQVREFGRKMKASDTLFVLKLDAKLKKLGFRPHKIENFSNKD